jgi:bacillithiol synthase
MKIEKISFEDVPGFSPLFLDYIKQKPDLNSFYEYTPDLEGIKKAIAKRSFCTEHRSILVESLKTQYSGLSLPSNVQLLAQENTFTVTTGHQLNLATGPLYVIYKIVSTINLAKQLQATFPDYNFVPVYWMASEDHDFDEINHFTLFGKKYEWATEQTGAVGRMHLSEVLELIESVPQLLPEIKEAYSKAKTLAEAVRYYMHTLFGSEGLVCLDADSPALKALFIPVMESEIEHQLSITALNATGVALQQAGYKQQLNGREINLFYLDSNIRERIVFENNSYKILNTDLQFTPQELLDLLRHKPENFSPNVVLRPLYQENILPNIAYLGGPSECTYWLQLKEVFAVHNVSFPVVLPRNFALYVSASNAQKLSKNKLELQELFQGEQTIKELFLKRNATELVDFNKEKDLFNKLLENYLQKAISVDKSLEGAVLAERQKTLVSFENLEKRIKKSEEKRYETGLNQVYAVKSKLFPEGEPQERVDNFMSISLNNPLFIECLFHNFNPLEFNYLIITEE